MYDILTAPEVRSSLRPPRHVFPYSLQTQNFFEAIRRFSSSVILSVTYGKRAPRITTKEVTDFFEMHPIYEHLLFPGAYAPVDFIPLLKKLPAPLARWKEVCQVVRKMQKDLYFGLLKEVEKRLSNGEGNGCFMESVIQRAGDWGFDRDMVG